MQRYYLAVDIGASSGRHIIGWMENNKIRLEEVYRFENCTTEKNGHLVWDHESLFAEILCGLRACRDKGMIPVSMGIDTWGVDFALIGPDGNIIGDTVAYRDHRTKGIPDTLDDTMLYARTGIQRQPFNTIYQLLAVKQQSPAMLEKAEHMLLMPEYFQYLLTGNRVCDYTNSSTTGLLDAKTRTWDWALIRELGLPERIFGVLHEPGTGVGMLSAEIARQIGFTCQVVLAPTHDTASAVLSAPIDPFSLYLSSGTWSLMGAEKQQPLLTEQSRKAGLSNEGGVDKTYRHLKNIMGLWIIQRIRKELPTKLSFPELAGMAMEAEYFTPRIDVNDESFLSPTHMTEAIHAYLKRTGQPLPQNAQELLSCVMQSLSESYAATVCELSELNKVPYNRVCIVGGGSQNDYLNRLTARACGMAVTAGPVEATALGNLAVQMIKDGRVADVASAREIIAQSFELKKYTGDEQYV
jgi:rhamnulokinase